MPCWLTQTFRRISAVDYEPESAMAASVNAIIAARNAGWIRNHVSIILAKSGGVGMERRSLLGILLGVLEIALFSSVFEGGTLRFPS